MGFDQTKRFTALTSIVLGLVSVCFGLPETKKEVEAESKKVIPAYGVIKGVVRDRKGKPISKATVAVFRVGSTKLLKQVTATRSGRFLARIIPGTYTVLAVAQGFNPVTLKKVSVGGSDEFVYGFKLERSGSGKTLSDKRSDKNSSKWAIRASRRSIYQANEGDAPVEANAVNPDALARSAESDQEIIRPGATIVETFSGVNRNGSVKGVNFATLRPVGESAELLISGQVSDKGIGSRVDTSLSFDAGKKHRIRLRGTVSNVGDIVIDDQREHLSQISFQAFDQWKVKDGVIVVVGFDFSKFVGAGKELSFSPRLGVQYDLDSKTRLRSAYTTRNEPMSWGKVVELEGNQAYFSDPVAIRDISLNSDGKAEMNRSSRFEIGLERVLDNRSTIEANVFMDSFTGRGFGLDKLPLGASQSFERFIGRQAGSATGMRTVINRRLSSIFSTRAGYSFGAGQQLSSSTFDSPAAVLEGNVFQTAFGGFTADFGNGTSIDAIYRFSPEATVFAIDPFEGRLAIFDPGLSLVVTRSLPRFGLPIDAEATLDARNVFDRMSGIDTDDGRLFLSAQRRSVRGSIMVRF